MASTTRGLRIWLPLTTDTHNQGLSSVTISGGTQQTGGKLSTNCYKGAINIGYGAGHTAVGVSTCFWFKPTSVSGLILYFQFLESGNTRYYLATHDALLYPACGAGGTNGKTTITAGTWYHIAMVVESDCSMNVYLNGTLECSVGKQSSFNLANNALLYNTACYLDLRIYDYALTADLVHEISLGKIGHWMLNEFGSKPNLTKGSYDYNSSTILTGDFRINPNVGSVDSTAFHNTPAWHSYRIGLTSTSWSEFGVFSHYGHFTAGKTYTLSYWCKINNTSTDYAIPYYFSTGRYYKTNDSTTYTFTVTPVKQLDATKIGVWQKIIQTFVAPSDCTDYFYLFTTVRLNCDYYIARIKVEEEGDATPWINEGINTYMAYDSSGFNNSLSATGSLSLSNDSVRYNNSMQFDGSTSYLSGTSPISSGTYINEFSASGWVKADSGFNTSVGIHPLSFNNYFFRMSLGKSSLLWTYWNVSNADGSSNTQSVVDYGSASNIDTSKWYHIAATFKKGIINIYLNGSCVATKDLSATYAYLKNATSTMYIGSYSTASEIAKGKISDVRMYMTALTSDDVKKLYNLK